MTVKSKIQWEDLTLEKQVPVPTHTPKTSARMQLLGQMEPNDSFSVPKQHYPNLISALARFRKAHKGKHFVTRTVDADTVRCWRIK